MTCLLTGRTNTPWLTSHGCDLIRCRSHWTLSTYLTCNAAWVFLYPLCARCDFLSQQRMSTCQTVNSSDDLKRRVCRRLNASSANHLQIKCWFRRQMRLTFLCSCSTRSAPVKSTWGHLRLRLDSDWSETGFFKLAASIKKEHRAVLEKTF